MDSITEGRTRILEDEEIVTLYLKRNEAAIQHTSEKYGRRLRLLALSITGDQQTAEECENDTYMAAWNAIPPHEPRTYFFAFLAKITRQLSLSCCRKRRRLKRSAYISQLSSEIEQCIPAPDDMECRIDNIALREAINTFLGQLNAEKRNVFLRRYWYLDSISDIAKRYALSESKVKTMLFRIRKEFREYLIKEDYTI